MYYLFPTDFQFEPKKFNSLFELDIFCTENLICNCLVNESVKSTRSLCIRWNIHYFKGMHKNTFVGF